MEIISTQCHISSNAVRVVDTGNDMIINTVPYNKETNSPIPFNNISILRGNQTCVGKKAIHPCFYKNPTTYGAVYQYQSMPDKKAVNMIVDNLNPNICYISPSKSNMGSEIPSDYKHESNSSTYQRLYKLEKKSNGQITKTCTSSIITANPEEISSNSINTIYMTQTNTHVFVVLRCFYGYSSTSGKGNEPYYMVQIVKIDKENLSVTSSNYINYSYLNSSYPNYLDGSTLQTSYYCYQPNGNVFKILKETKDGLYIYTKNIVANNYASENTTFYYNTRLIFYSFESGLVTDMLLNKTSSTECPCGLPTDTSSSANSIGKSYLPRENMQIPSECLETESDYYTYFYTLKGKYNTSTLENNFPNTLFYMNFTKDNSMYMNINEVTLIFPEDAEIKNIPINIKESMSSTSLPTVSDWGVYETYVTNTNGIDYVHIIYKGLYPYNANTRGIYTFKVNEEKTEATFTSFYPALGDTLAEFMPLTDDREKIVLTTNTSYHILKFDLVSESWISTYDSLTKVKSMIQTDENKLYYISEDDSIHCQDLNGAVTIDFEFEKQVYNYNNADINSYISIWALDSEGNYCATNIKLTIIGNAVWQTNGLQTLETSTSAEGPINIPFVIKGHTAINVGVDAII